MRRLVALLVMLAFAAATAAPAVAACRMRAARQRCCCAAPPPGAICAPDCCGAVKAAGRLDEIATQPRGLLLLARPAIVCSPRVDFPPAARTPPMPRPIGLHERAAPRLPLRV